MVAGKITSYLALPEWAAQLMSWAMRTPTARELAAVFTGIWENVKRDEFSKLNRVLLDLPFDEISNAAMLAVLRGLSSYSVRLPGYPGAVSKVRQVLGTRGANVEVLMAGFES